MKIAIGSDHRGVDLKRRLIASLREQGHEVLDLGPETHESVDYPDFAYEVARRVSNREVDRGLLICGTGIGMSIAANKVKGVRAASVNDTISAELCRRHNDANVLCVSADLLGEELIGRMVRIFVETPFDAGRHARRVEKIAKIENKMCE